MTIPVPLPTMIPESVVEPVPPFATASVPPKDESERQVLPIAKQPAVRFTPVAKVEVAAVRVVVAVPFDMESSVVDAPLLKVWSADHIFALERLRAREVEPPRATDPPPERPEPAETVRAPLLMRRELPMVVVATICPPLLVERRPLVIVVRKVLPLVVKFVVEAFANWVNAVCVLEAVSM